MTRSPQATVRPAAAGAPTSDTAPCTTAAPPTTPAAAAAAASKGHVHPTALPQAVTPPPSARRPARALRRRRALCASRRPKATLDSTLCSDSSCRLLFAAPEATFASAFPTTLRLCTPHTATAATGSVTSP